MRSTVTRAKPPRQANKRMSYLRELVLQKVRSFSTPAEAAAFFEVGEGLIKQWDAGSKPVSLAAVERVFDVNTMPGTAKVQEAMWEGKSVAILMPCYKNLNPRTSVCVMSMLDRAKMGVLLDWGDAFVIHSRNKLADGFLKSTIEWSLSLDDDMVIPFGNAPLFNTFTGFNFPESAAGLHTINRLMSHGKTLVGALYFGRWKHAKAVYCEAHQDPQEELYARKAPHLDVCKPTRWVGTGCLLAHRSVFLDIEKKFPHLARNRSGDYGHWYSPSEHDMKQAVTEAMDVLNDGTTSEASRVSKARSLMERGTALSRSHSALGTGEDVSFCVRAQQSGHTPHVDLGLVCGHVGEAVYGPRKSL